MRQWEIEEESKEEKAYMENDVDCRTLAVY